TPDAPPGSERYPTPSHLLVRPQLGAQLGAGKELSQRVRRAQAGEAFCEPGTGPDARPVGDVRFQRGRCVALGPSQEPHRLEERDPTAASCALRLLPMCEDLLELVPIDLHPASANQREPMVLRRQCPPFLLA